MLLRRFVHEVLDDTLLGRPSIPSLIDALHAVERLEGMVLAGAGTECARRLADAVGWPLPGFAAPPAPWLRTLSDQALADWLMRRGGELAAATGPHPSPEAALLMLGVAHLLQLDPLIAA